MTKFAPEVFSSHSLISDGQLHIGGAIATDIAEEHGTPLFVIDQADFDARALAWKGALESAFEAQAGTVYYAAKSFICKEVARWVARNGLGIDVCSGGELAVAKAAGFDMSKVELHGNNKSLEEIKTAISLGVGTIVMDSFQEIERVALLAEELGKVQKVYLRITPGVDAHTHEAISTAHEDVKFGFSLASGAAWNAITETGKHASLNLAGLHSHIGSQIFDSEGFEIAAGKLIGLLARYRDECGAELPELDLGGGYGIAYLAGEKSLDANSVLADLAKVVKAQCAAAKLAVPRISIEPGRAIVGPTTTTLYTVGTTKDVTLDDGKVRRYVSVDGGMSDNIRPSLYDADYMAIIANRTSTSAEVNTRIVGKHCETGDIVIRQIALADDVGPGDILAVPATGAYGRSMASNYNHITRPAVVAVLDGKTRVIVRRESTEDLLSLEL